MSTRETSRGRPVANALARFGVAPYLERDQPARDQRDDREREQRRYGRRRGRHRDEQRGGDEARAVEAADVAALERAQREQVQRDAAAERDRGDDPEVRVQFDQRAPDA